MQFTHAIFDMDGTLVDSMGYWDEVCGEFLRDLGIYSEEVFDKMKPMTVPQTAEYLKTTFGITQSPQGMVEHMLQLMHAHYLNDVKPKSGVFEFLEALKQKNVHCCVASSTPSGLVETCLKQHNLTQYFNFLISAEEVGIGKDHPDIFFEAAKRLGAEPTQTIVFEDAMTAGITAKNAGFLTVAVFDETSKAEWDAYSASVDAAIVDWHEGLQKLF